MPFKYNALLGLGLDNTIPLDGAGKIPSTFLPSYVDDVEEYNNLAAFPATGETGKIYVAIDTGFVYRWSGSVYVQIGITAAAGSTTQVQFNDGGAFGGDSGLTFDKTTDALSAGGFIPTSSTVPANGIYLPAANSVGVATNGSGRLFVDASGNIGINTASPQNYGAGYTPLTIDASTSPSIELRVAGTRYGRIFASTSSLNLDTWAATPMIFGINTAEKMRLTSTGLGIGTTAPQEILELRKDSAGASVVGALLTNASSNASTAIGISFSPNTGGTTRSASIYGVNETASQNATALTFHTNANAASGTEKVRIDSSGRFLVGTSTSSANTRAIFVGYAGVTTDQGIIFLQNGGSASIASDATLGSLRFTNSSESIGGIINCDAEATWTSGSSQPTRLTFSTTSTGAASVTERLRITSAGVLQVADAGNIQVGTTTGTKIGTATTQKLGFYNATPVVQPTAVADATDAATVITQLNALLAKLRTLGIIAT